MLIDNVNDVINGALANKLKGTSIQQLEAMLTELAESKSMPEVYMEPELIISLLLHCELVFAQELKKRYDKISENN